MLCRAALCRAREEHQQGGGGRMADGSDVDYEYEVNPSRVRASKRRYAEQRRGARAGTQVEGDGSDGRGG